MPLYARRIDRPALWSNLDEPDAWVDGDFPYSALTELADGRNKGLSCFEIRSRRDRNLRRVAAALTLAGEGKLSNMEFRLISPKLISRLKLQSKKTDGKTFDGQVNAIHVELTGLNGSSAIKFARGLRNNSIVVSREKIFDEIIFGIKRGYFDYKKVNKGEVAKAIAERYCVHLSRGVVPGKK